MKRGDLKMKNLFKKTCENPLFLAVSFAFLFAISNIQDILVFLSSFPSAH